MTLTRDWADCGAIQDGGTWVAAHPFINETTSLSEDSNSCERGGSYLDKERVGVGENNRIQSNSSSSEID